MHCCWFQPTSVPALVLRCSQRFDSELVLFPVPEVVFSDLKACLDSTVTSLCQAVGLSQAFWSDRAGSW